MELIEHEYMMKRWMALKFSTRGKLLVIGSLHAQTTNPSTLKGVYYELIFTLTWPSFLPFQYFHCIFLVQVHELFRFF
jgi:hypothetical protein